MMGVGFRKTGRSAMSPAAESNTTPSARVARARGGRMHTYMDS